MFMSLVVIFLEPLSHVARPDFFYFSFLLTISLTGKVLPIVHEHMTSVIMINTLIMMSPVESRNGHVAMLIVGV